MGFLNWRTSKSIGPINVTASSGGVGASLRLPGGLRVGLSPRGRLMVSFSKGGLSLRKTVGRPSRR